MFKINVNKKEDILKSINKSIIVELKNTTDNNFLNGSIGRLNHIIECMRAECSFIIKDKTNNNILKIDNFTYKYIDTIMTNSIKYLSNKCEFKILPEDKINLINELFEKKSNTNELEFNFEVKFTNPDPKIIHKLGDYKLYLG